MSDSIGARLRQARELRRLTLLQVSETTKLGTHHLQALENDDYTAIPSAAQARGFLRIYAGFLELDLAELLPPAAPAAPVAVETPAAVTTPEPAHKPATSGMFASLRQRLSHTRKAEAAEAGPAEAPADILADALPEAIVPEAAESSAASDVPLAASSEAPTARHPKVESPEVKKNEAELAVVEPGPEAAAPAEPTTLAEQATPAVLPDFQRSDELVSDLVTEPDVPPRRPRWPFGVLRSRMPKRTAPKAQATEARPALAAAGPDGGQAFDVNGFNPLPAQGPANPVPSAQIFVEIGRQLCERREMLSLTYEEIERHTHVRTAFLGALERGALDELPSPVQTRGILVNYATFLDLDADAILLRFADGLQAQYREKGPQRKSGRTRPPMTVHTTLPPLRAFIASDLVFGGGLAIMLLLFAVWGISRVLNVRSQTAARATPPPISAVLVGTALPTIEQQVTVIPAQDTPAAALLDVASPTLELATLDPNVNVQVVLTASERAYLRVMVDGKLAFEGRTEAGGKYTYQAENQVEVVVGNAAAIQVAYNEHDLGLMGAFGEVVDRLYTAEGIATPTSTPAPTNTPTPFVTSTPTETATRTPTLTPKP